MKYICTSKHSWFSLHCRLSMLNQYGKNEKKNRKNLMFMIGVVCRCHTQLPKWNICNFNQIFVNVSWTVYNIINWTRFSVMLINVSVVMWKTVAQYYVYCWIHESTLIWFDASFDLVLFFHHHLVLAFSTSLFSSLAHLEANFWRLKV